MLYSLYTVQYTLEKFFAIILKKGIDKNSLI